MLRWPPNRNLLEPNKIAACEKGNLNAAWKIILTPVKDNGPGILRWQPLASKRDCWIIQIRYPGFYSD